MEPEQKKADEKSMSSMNSKTMYIIGGVIVVIIIGFVSFIMVRGDKQETPAEIKKAPTQEEIIPTVDASVKVKIVPHLEKKKFDLVVSGIPDSTTTLEYELTYQTAKGGLPGYSSAIDIESGQDTYEKKDFLLGTCSTGGACTYDEVVGPLKVTIKFTGSYGEKLFEKDFELK